MSAELVTTSLSQSDVDTGQAAVSAACVVVAAVLFNFLLAVWNAHTGGVGPREVIAAEGLVLASAHIIILITYRPAVAPWYALIWFLICVNFARWAWLGQIDPKTLRDVAIIPTFLALGVVAGKRRLNTMTLWIQAVIVAVMLLEYFATDFYSEIVNVKAYYISTRGFDESAFWNQESDLFVSATRPTDRVFFPQLNIHRLSSVFLEPVSLGNYCTIITAFICARFHSLSWTTLAFLILSNVMLLIACDGRLAVSTSAAIVLIALAAPHLPYASTLFLPSAVAVAGLLHGVLGVPAGSDDFSGRISLTGEFLARMPLADYLGVSADRLPGLADSGLAYLINMQSIFGVALIWLFLNIFIDERTPEQSRAKHGMLLYLALTMIVSYSFLSVKTAALAWFILGALHREGLRGTSQNPAQRGAQN